MEIGIIESFSNLYTNLTKTPLTSVREDVRE
jgi:hypothetical protein